MINQTSILHLSDLDLVLVRSVAFSDGDNDKIISFSGSTGKYGSRSLVKKYQKKKRKYPICTVVQNAKRDDLHTKTQSYRL